MSLRRRLPHGIIRPRGVQDSPSGLILFLFFVFCFFCFLVHRWWKVTKLCSLSRRMGIAKTTRKPRNNTLGATTRLASFLLCAAAACLSCSVERFNPAKPTSDVTCDCDGCYRGCNQKNNPEASTSFILNASKKGTRWLIFFVVSCTVPKVETMKSDSSGPFSLTSSTHPIES